jgi:hypothetical protein
LGRTPPILIQPFMSLLWQGAPALRRNLPCWRCEVRQHSSGVF